MSTTLFFAVAAGVIISAIVLRSRQDKADAPNLPKRMDAGELRRIAATAAFFRDIRRGDRAHPLARIYSQTDIALIDSILVARRIKFHFFFERMNKVRTGLGAAGYNDVWLYVTRRQYHQARMILCDYLETRRRSVEKVPRWTKVRNIGELLLFGWASGSTYRLPELVRPVVGRRPMRSRAPRRGRRRISSAVRSASPSAGRRDVVDS